MNDTFEVIKYLTEKLEEKNNKIKELEHEVKATQRAVTEKDHRIKELEKALDKACRVVDDIKHDCSFCPLYQTDCLDNTPCWLKIKEWSLKDE